MPKKAYIIVHDGTNILIGQGGKSGKNKTVRQGYHLPGGTVKRNPKETVIRELKEETGIVLDEAQITENARQMVDEEYTIDFFIVEVESVETLVKQFQRPPVTNTRDEPFASLLSLESKDSWDNENFDEKYNTNWFGEGLSLFKDILNPT